MEQMLDPKVILYRKVSMARESCAGCCPKNKRTVARLITEAKETAAEFCASASIMNKLDSALAAMKKAKTYKDRLPIDNLLCELLNIDLH